jgi:hypothetical protein
MSSMTSNTTWPSWSDLSRCCRVARTLSLITPDMVCFSLFVDGRVMGLFGGEVVRW